MNTLMQRLHSVARVQLPLKVTVRDGIIHMLRKKLYLPRWNDGFSFRSITRQRTAWFISPFFFYAGRVTKNGGYRRGNDENRCECRRRCRRTLTQEI